MKRLLKYLIPVIFAAAFFMGADISVSSSQQEFQIFDIALTADSNQGAFSASDSDFCLPRQVSFANSSRLQNNSRRTENSHRHGFEFVKAGKVLNPGVIYLVLRNSVLIHSALVKPANRLVCLCKFII